MEKNFHRLLNRQINEFKIFENFTIDNFSNFLISIDKAYKDYDKDFSVVERSLIESSDELFKANNKLNEILSNKNILIEKSSSKLKKLAFNLENAERIAGLGNFSLNISDNSFELSDQLVDLLKLSKFNFFDNLDKFIKIFKNSNKIKSTINNSIKNQTRFRIEKIRLKSDTRYFTMEGLILKDFDRGTTSLICVIQDITNFIKTEENNIKIKEFYEAILNNIPVDIAVFNKEHKYLFVNPIAVQNKNIRDFLIGKDDFEYCRHFNKDLSIAKKRRSLFLDVLNKNISIEFVDESTSAEGKTRYRLRRFSPVYKNNNELLFMIGFGLDITEKIEQELHLKRSLEEKQSLLGEIHHRVKNNLALVTGLIELQSSSIDNLVIKKHLSEIQHRISAMSLIHEKLYKTSNFSKIDLKDYLHDLISSLGLFFNKEANVKVNFDLEQVFINSKKIIPIALIINEIVTNSYKYAFKDKKSGVIDVCLKIFDNEIELLISDSGDGMPQDFNISTTKSLGFKLINIFTKQLKGTLQYYNNPGLTILIKFKNE